MMQRLPMTDLSIRSLLSTASVSVRDVVCSGACRHKSAEECSSTTHLVFPYRGVYVRHLHREDTVAEANQVVFFNEGESYHISHPVGGGDACLSFAIGESLLHELTPKEHVRKGGAMAFRRQQRRLDAAAQMSVARLRHSLSRDAAETLEAESLALSLVQNALGNGRSNESRAGAGKSKLVNRARLVLSSDLSRRWTLAEIAREVGVSPVYLTQVFQQVEAMPLYRYQLRLRLVRALDLLPRCEDLTRLGLELGFSSHSHFSSAFRQVYGRTPAQFRAAAQGRH